MKKKGFTLIELLAVIVILAIIALIATPLVLKYIEKSRKESKVDSAYSFVRNLETEIANYSIKHNGKKYNKSGLVEIGDLTDIDTTVKGDKPDAIKVCLSSLGQVDKAMFEYGNYYVSYDGKKGSISDKDTYDKFSCSSDSGNAGSFERIYDYGDIVTFDPGDGERTWNVIGEDRETVTLLLSKNLGDNIDWYSSTSDNSYGPKDALEYLNSLTKNWSNVDPIASYSYVNNLDGTAEPYGYQKVEITNGVTTLTHKDGKTTKLDEKNKAKARLLTIEEIVEIASKTNKNFTEENLEGYITKNLSKINIELGITATNVDEVIASISAKAGFEWLKYESKHVQLYYIVVLMVEGNEIDIEYNILFPEYLYKKLNIDEGLYGYWTLSSNYIEGVWIVEYRGTVDVAAALNSEGDVGLRPFITVSKSKI